jgi:hypothetical protein
MSEFHLIYLKSGSGKKIMICSFSKLSVDLILLAMNWDYRSSKVFWGMRNIDFGD